MTESIARSTGAKFLIFMLQVLVLALLVAAPHIVSREFFVEEASYRETDSDGETAGGEDGIEGTSGDTDKPDGFEAILRDYWKSREFLRSRNGGPEKYFIEAHALRKEDPQLFRDSLSTLQISSKVGFEHGELLEKMLGMLQATDDRDDMIILSFMLFSHTSLERTQTRYSNEEVGLITAAFRKRVARIGLRPNLASRFLLNVMRNFARLYGDAEQVRDLVRETASGGGFIATMRECPEDFLAFCLSPATGSGNPADFEKQMRWTLGLACGDLYLLAALVERLLGEHIMRGLRDDAGLTFLLPVRLMSPAASLADPSWPLPDADAQDAARACDQALRTAGLVGSSGAGFAVKCNSMIAMMYLDPGSARKQLIAFMKEENGVENGLAAAVALLLTVGFGGINSDEDWNAVYSCISKAVGETRIVEGIGMNVLQHPYRGVRMVLRPVPFSLVPSSFWESKNLFESLISDFQTAMPKDAEKSAKLTDLLLLVRERY